MMTAVDFLKTVGRMCQTYKHCSDGCPMHSKNCDLMQTPVHLTEEIVQIVEQWGKDHPVKTRQSELLKMFPYADMRDDIVNICPMKVNDHFRCDAPYTDCAECRKKYWLEEVK